MVPCSTAQRTTRNGDRPGGISPQRRQREPNANLPRAAAGNIPPPLAPPNMSPTPRAPETFPRRPGNLPSAGDSPASREHSRCRVRNNEQRNIPLQLKFKFQPAAGIFPCGARGRDAREMSVGLFGPIKSPLEVVPNCDRAFEEAHGTVWWWFTPCEPSHSNRAFRSDTRNMTAERHSPRAFASRRFSAVRVAPGRLRRKGAPGRQIEAGECGAEGRAFSHGS